MCPTIPGASASSAHAPAISIDAGPILPAAPPRIARTGPSTFSSPEAPATSAAIPSRTDRRGSSGVHPRFARECTSRGACTSAAPDRTVEPGFAHADIRDREAVRSVLEAGIDGAPYDAVIHFAGRKAVGESVEDPLGYWSTNVTGTIVLLEELHRAGVYRLVFSSTCTVYDTISQPPYTENHATGPINPYSRTKLAVETVLRDLAQAESNWSSPCCATSIRSAHMRRVTSAKIRTASPTTSCPSSPRWP